MHVHWVAAAAGHTPVGHQSSILHLNPVISVVLLASAHFQRIRVCVTFANQSVSTSSFLEFMSESCVWVFLLTNVKTEQPAMAPANTDFLHQALTGQGAPIRMARTAAKPVIWEQRHPLISGRYQVCVGNWHIFQLHCILSLAKNYNILKSRPLKCYHLWELGRETSGRLLSTLFWGTFKYLVIPFGCINALVVFQALVSNMSLDFLHHFVFTLMTFSSLPDPRIKTSQVCVTCYNSSRKTAFM